MTRITHRGQLYEKISKADWENEGGVRNPDLLKLRNKRRNGRGYLYFRSQSPSW